MTPKQASLKKMLRLLRAAKRREALAQADRVDVSALVTAGEVDADEDGT
jgi:hypothetical protein